MGYCQAIWLGSLRAGQRLNSSMACRRLDGSTAGQQDGLMGYCQARWLNGLTAGQRNGSTGYRQAQRLDGSTAGRRDGLTDYR
jgi:hypothetical protein